MLEILAPAGSEESALAAIHNGANVVYLGLNSFSARQGAENFDFDGLTALLQKAHFCGVRVYVAMNTIVKENELPSFVQTLVRAWNTGVDAIILQDIFLGRYIHRHYPEIVLHLSTQAGVCTKEGARFAKEYGFKRVILARETPLSEIAEIAKIIETEVFVQGALCTAFSGQCYFSSFVGGNSGNRGRCKQPCRKLYSYDRNGNEEKCYALSLSDLCVGEDIQKLIRAGVTSFKIEGRMRRAEYVGAAVRYYRQILDEGQESTTALSDLKRTYNRGNYTRGLAFGQDKRLLSTAIQGHVGEKVGVVKVVGGRFLVESAFRPQTGDAFKILREGKEVAGATYVKTEGRAFVLQSRIRLKNGDGVFVTTDTAVNARVLGAQKRGALSLRLRFIEGETAKLSCGELSIEGETPLQSAQNRPLCVEEVKACFRKTDGLPVDIHFDEVNVSGDIFIPKSELNALRRTFYAAICERIAKGKNKQYDVLPVQAVLPMGANAKTAVISEDFTGISTEIAVYKPKDFSVPLPADFLRGDFEKYLYIPPFVTSGDLRALQALVQAGEFQGIYAESYAGLAIAKEWGVKLFAGTGFHILNSLSLAILCEEDCLAYYAISKEANAEEAQALKGEKAFVLSSGDIKLMDLCYCPFGKACSRCDKRERYTLTDEGGRKFPVRRYLAADGSCRFEVYNCASLISVGVKGTGKLTDVSVMQEKAAAVSARDSEGKQKVIYDSYTSGHYKRGVL